MQPEITYQRIDDLVKAIRNNLGIRRGGYDWIALLTEHLSAS